MDEKALTEIVEAPIATRPIHPLEYNKCIAPALRSPFRDYDNMTIREFVEHVRKNASFKNTTALINRYFEYNNDFNRFSIRPVLTYFVGIAGPFFLALFYVGEKKKHEAYHYWEKHGKKN